MTHKQAFHLAYTLLKDGVQCSLGRDVDGVWHVKACGDSVKYNELFGDMK